MTRIVTAATIARPIEDVYQYVTTPEHWPRWHPSSLAVSGAAAGHSMLPGEQVEEAFNVAGRKGRVVWTVTECEAPRRWVIDGKIIGGGSGAVSYALAPAENGSGTRFMREFAYPTPSLLHTILDRLYIQRRISAESAEAVRRLKALLEAGELSGSTLR